MRILGVSEIDNDAGAVLLSHGHIVGAINEERLSRHKRHRGFPHLSVAWLLELAGIELADIDHIAIAKADPKFDADRFRRAPRLLASHAYLTTPNRAPLWVRGLNLAVNRLRNAGRTAREAKKMAAEIQGWVRRHDVQAKIVTVPHHHTHAACAYWASGFRRALAITLDGQGEGTSSEIYLVEDGNFKRLAEIHLPDSLGLFYAAATKTLGFTPGRHEGKVTGLAAYAKPNQKLLDGVRRLAWNDTPGSYRSPNSYGAYPLMRRWLSKHGPQQFAAAFQRVLEEVTCRYVSHYIEQTGVGDLVLAGGVFGNVKLNQSLLKLGATRRVFVFPHMADGGLGYGAAQSVYRKRSGDKTIAPISDVYWGPEFSSAQIAKAITSHRLKAEQPPNIETRVAELLSKGYLVAHFAGRMEFGPRALGNRSILYTTTDSSVNDWLNVLLKRNEFMPFAPITLHDHADECYVSVAGAEQATAFMTIAVDCTHEMRKQSPAVVHVDGTARPQLLRPEHNPRLHRILSEYHRLTGIPSLINTSFNMHEEPIVCTPDDALRAFVAAKLDFLAIGSFLLKAPAPRKRPAAV